MKYDPLFLFIELWAIILIKKQFVFKRTDVGSG